VISVDPYTMQFAKQSLLLFFLKKRKRKIRIYLLHPVRVSLCIVQ
jgi:hypothetical protein